MSRTVAILRAVLCAYLLVWEPLNVASELLQAWPSLNVRGPWAVVELAIHAVFATLTVAGALALWNRSPHGVVVAAAGVGASTARILQVGRFSVLPHDLPPDLAPVIAVVALAQWVFWSAFLFLFRHQLTDHTADGQG